MTTGGNAFNLERRDLPEGVYALEELSSPRVAELAAERAVVILPISPIEEHGPHLPMGTDAINAAHFARLSATIVREIERDTPVVLAPLIPVGTHVYRFMGSISIRQRVIRNLVIDYGRSLAAAGFGRLLIVSAHGGPGHMVALDEAAGRLSRRHHIYTVSLTSRLIFEMLSGRFVESISAALPTPLTDEERTALSMDYHAGWFETALMLSQRPDLVDPKHRELPDALVPRWKLRAKTPLKPPAGQGYLGAPGRANAEFAAACMSVLRGEARKIVEEFLRANRAPSRFRSPLYRVPLFRTDFWIWVGITVIVLLAILRNVM